MDISLARFIPLARGCPRVGMAFDRVEVRVFASRCIYLFRPLRRLPIYWANVFALRLLFTTSDNNQAEEQSQKEDEVLQAGHTSILLHVRKLNSLLGP